MDILIVSDTHGRRDRMKKLLDRTNPGVLLFLGDGLGDLSVVPDTVTVRAVRGNCDVIGRDVPEARVEDFGACRVFMTHGHRFGVKSHVETVAVAALNTDADVLLYGHTHVPFERTLPAGFSLGDRILQKPLLIFCPGSLGDPRDGTPTFGTLTVRQNDILAGLGTL